MKIGLKLKRISYAGKSVGRDIRVEVEVQDKMLRIQKRINHGTVAEFDDVVGVFDPGQRRFEAEITIKITERDLLFSDAGSVSAVMRVDDVTSLPRVFEYAISVIERRKIFWKTTAVFSVAIEAYDADGARASLKTYRLYLRKDYNRYDAIIQEVTDRWNSGFANDTDPPTAFLDPDLVKAIIFQETRVGNDKRNDGAIDIMQVGNRGDASLKTLRGELSEYWIHEGKEILLKYEARVETVRDSVYWGVRWLYHKDQYIGFDGRRHWNSWKEAVHKYGPNKKEYTENIWSIYTKGFEKEKDGTIITLWAIALFLLMATPFCSQLDAADLIRETVVRQFHNSVWPVYTVAVEFSYRDKNLFAAILEEETDWWEDLHIGRLDGPEIRWLEMADPPTEQSIFSARFIGLEGIPDPVLEVYGKTHVGHGNLYLYRVGNKEVSLLLSTRAVDSYNESVWRPGGYPEYGYAACGHIYKGERLLADYRDENGDGISDAVLHGNIEVICEDVISDDPFAAQDVSVAELPVHEVHFLNTK
jgi:hypothetical protein